MEFEAHLISWNVTKRCNSRCAHCYLDASDVKGERELTTKEGLKLIDQMAEVNPGAMLVLSGGEPLMRGDILDLARYASQKGLMVVVGTNGTLIDNTLAEGMKGNGVSGVGISLESLNQDVHDAFRGVKGAWDKTLRGIEACKNRGLPFQIQTTLAKGNYNEVPSLIEYSHRVGARAFNLFFLVCTGRGEDLSDITPAQHEEVLSYLATIQGKYDDMIVRARCAPHFIRLIHQQNRDPILLKEYPKGCLAGTHYCRITPEGDVTPCPYLPLKAGNVRERGFREIWKNAEVFQHLRYAKLKGRCGFCDFASVCGGCRARAYAFCQDYLGEDPWCSYLPEGRGPRIMEEEKVIWTEEARRRFDMAPSFIRGIVMNKIEQFARYRGYSIITLDLIGEFKKGSIKNYGQFH